MMKLSLNTFLRNGISVIYEAQLLKLKVVKFHVETYDSCYQDIELRTQ